MNERIEELAQGCFEYIEGTLDGDIVEFDYKKFAELIAKEYIENCRDMFIVGSVSWNLLNEKLEHFGVQE
jgi:hypothetical protein